MCSTLWSKFHSMNTFYKRIHLSVRPVSPACPHSTDPHRPQSCCTSSQSPPACLPSTPPDTSRTSSIIIIISSSSGTGHPCCSKTGFHSHTKFHFSTCNRLSETKFQQKFSSLTSSLPTRAWLLVSAGQYSCQPPSSPHKHPWTVMLSWVLSEQLLEKIPDIHNILEEWQQLAPFVLTDLVLTLFVNPLCRWKNKNTAWTP